MRLTAVVALVLCTVTTATRGDAVTIHEALSLPDGRTVFDSRVAPNKPVTFDPAFIPPTATRLYDIEVLAARP